MLDRRFSVAPMMDCTDRHARFLLRLCSARALLYTEMVTAAAVIHGNRQRLLGFSGEEHPVSAQLGGSDPAQLAEAARIAAEAGYDEIDLNCGCPSDRVQSGRFGAVLMTEPETVAACVSAMSRAVSVPITVKCRLGVDAQVVEETLPAFLETVAAAGCQTFTIHARKAWLQGLSPKENRNIPPLDYELVYRMKQRYPQLEIVLNGGIKDVSSARPHLEHVDGVMVGRAAYHTPYLLADVDREIYGEQRTAPARTEVLRSFAGYIAAQMDAGESFYSMARHTLGMAHGIRGGRAFRRHLSVYGPRTDASAQTLIDAIEYLEGAKNLGQGEEPTLAQALR